MPSRISTSRSPSPEQQHPPLHSPRTASQHHSASSTPVTYIPPLIDGACGTVPHAQKPRFQALKADTRALLWLLPDLALTAWDAVVNSNNNNGDDYSQEMSIATAVPASLSVAIPRGGGGLRGAVTGAVAWATAVVTMAVGWRWPGAGQVPWRYAVDVCLQIVVGVVELYIIMLALPIWLIFPGLVFSIWSVCSLAVVLCLCRLLNSSDPVVRHPGPAAVEGGSWMMGPDGEEERWFFAGGMGVSSRTTTDSALPRLTKLFNRPITAIVEPTYGVAVDLALLLAQRAGITLTLPPLPFGLGDRIDTQRLLYAQARAALQDPSAKRVVILAHNRGSLTASRVLSRLCADLPHAKLSSLEVYTFGAAADEFIVPLGGRDSSSTAPGNGSTPQSAAEFMARRGGPHIEHFAHARDPFARLGVLRSVREDLSGRFCGGVFVINAPGVSPMNAAAAARMGINGRNGAASSSTNNGSTSRLYNQYQYQYQPPQQQQLTGNGMMSPGGSGTTTSIYHGEDHRSPLLSGLLPAAPPVVSLDGYLAAMFPEQVPTLANCGRASVMESIMAVDRDAAERREQGAIASDTLAKSHAESLASKSGKRSGGGGGLGLRLRVKGGAADTAAVVGSPSSAAAVNGTNDDNSNNKRLSWTGLGAKVAGGSEDGLFGLKMARKMCEECKGHRGRELSRLCHYVNSGAVMSVGGGYGIDGVREEDVVSRRPVS